MNIRLEREGHDAISLFEGDHFPEGIGKTKGEEGNSRYIRYREKVPQKTDNSIRGRLTQLVRPKNGQIEIISIPSDSMGGPLSSLFCRDNLGVCTQVVQTKHNSEQVIYLNKWVGDFTARNSFQELPVNQGESITIVITSGAHVIVDFSTPDLTN